MFKRVGADMPAIGSGYKNMALYIVFTKIIYRKSGLQKHDYKNKKITLLTIFYSTSHRKKSKKQSFH